MARKALPPSSSSSPPASAPGPAASPSASLLSSSDLPDLLCCCLPSWQSFLGEAFDTTLFSSACMCEHVRVRAAGRAHYCGKTCLTLLAPSTHLSFFLSLSSPSLSLSFSLARSRSLALFLSTCMVKPTGARVSKSTSFRHCTRPQMATTATSERHGREASSSPNAEHTHHKHHSRDRPVEGHGKGNKGTKNAGAQKVSWCCRGGEREDNGGKPSARKRAASKTWRRLACTSSALTFATRACPSPPCIPGT